MKHVKHVEKSAFILFTFIVLTFAQSMFSHAQSEAESVISKFWAELGRTSHWSEFMASSVKDEYIEFANDSNNKNEFVGMLTVKEAKLLHVYSITEKEAPFYPELSQYKRKAYYRVVVAIDTHKENDYFKNGINEYCMSIVEDYSGYKVGSLSLYNRQWLDKARYGFANSGEEPSTINVKDQKGKVHYNVSLREFVFNVVCNEIGNENFVEDAVKSNIIAIKMCGWWFKRIGYYAGLGYDATFGMLTFLNYNRATVENQRYMNSCIDDVFDYAAYASNGKIFYMNYEAGRYNSYGKNDGVLKQYGSSYLADQGYSWQDILHYYYDNSSTNNPNTGIITIK